MRFLKLLVSSSPSWVVVRPNNRDYEAAHLGWLLLDRTSFSVLTGCFLCDVFRQLHGFAQFDLLKSMVSLASLTLNQNNLFILIKSNLLNCLLDLSPGHRLLP